ncbi:MAG: hypothetical protein ACOX8U_08125 [Bradymonadia bacterium]|jgi:hypothetical protein
MSQQEKKKWLFDLFLVSVIGGAAILIFPQSAGLWEPWESSVLMSAQRMASSNIAESAFWVPQLGDHLVFRPLAELWSVAAVLHFFPEATPQILRMPVAILGLWLLFLSFITIRSFFGRKSAYYTAIALLTLPMFAFSSKLLHGGIWPAAAIAAPLLHYIWIFNAKSRRALHLYQSIFGFSLLFSFLAGGLIALSAVLLIVLLIILFNKDKSRFLAFSSRFFVLPACVSLALILLVFSSYQSHIRYTLEYRTAVPLLALNENIEAGGLKSIAFRGEQVIGEFNNRGKMPLRNQRFILSRDPERLVTDSRLIFSENEVEARRFNSLMKERFGETSAIPQSAERANRESAFFAALRFFSLNAIDYAHHISQQSAKVAEAKIRFPYNAVFAYPLLREELEAQSPQTQLDESPILSFLTPNQHLIVDEQNIEESDFVRIELGNSFGYVHKSAIVLNDNESKLEFKRWARILHFGLFPWIAFLPLIFALCFAPRRLLEGGTREDKKVAFFQRSLAIWLLTASLLMLCSLSFSNHFVLIVTIPFAMACGLMCGSRHFIHDILRPKSLRLALAMVACSILWISFNEIERYHLRIFEYLLRDPVLKWRENLSLYPQAILVMRFSFIGVMLLSLFGIFTALVRLLQNKQETSAAELDDSSPERDTPHMSAEMPTPKMPSLLALVWRFSFRFLLLPLWHLLRFLRNPAMALCFIACVFAVFSNGFLLAKASRELNDQGIFEQYRSLANAETKLYLLNPEAARPCESYTDCSPGYSCVHKQCSLPNLASTMPKLAKSINEVELAELLASNEKFYLILPKDEFVSWNQRYRSMTTPISRRNFFVLNDIESRLILLANFSSTWKDLNPLNKIVRSTSIGIPNLPPSPLIFSNGIQIVGQTAEEQDGLLKLQVFLKLWRPITEEFQSFVSIHVQDYSRLYHHIPHKTLLPSELWLVEDVVIDSFEIPIEAKLAGKIVKVNYGLFTEHGYIELLDTKEEKKNIVELLDISLQKSEQNAKARWWRFWE